MEPKPSVPGSAYGQKSPGGEWVWNGTGRPDDAWVRAEPSESAQTEEQPTPHAPPAAGTAIDPATTIDELFVALFTTRSAETSGVPAYMWTDVGVIKGIFPDGSLCSARLEARPLAPAVLQL